MNIDYKHICPWHEPIEYLDLDVRPFNICKRGGIRTIRDLHDAIVDKTIYEFRHATEEVVYHLRSKLLDWYVKYNPMD